MVTAPPPHRRCTAQILMAVFAAVFFLGYFAAGKDTEDLAVNDTFVEAAVEAAKRRAANAAAAREAGYRETLARGNVAESSSIRREREACERRFKRTDFNEDGFQGGWVSSENMTAFVECLYRLRTRLRPQKTIHVGGIHYPTLLTAHHTFPPVSTAASQLCWLDDRGVNGNGLIQRDCCDVEKGPKGLAACWDDYFTYELCCLGDVGGKELPHFFVAPAFDINVGNAVRQVGTFDLGQSYALQALCRPGDIVLDIGANVGGFTVPLAERVGPRGEVHAFEPFRKVYQHLNANVAMNGLTNVFTYNVALGSTQKVVEVHTPDLTTWNFPSAIRVEGQYDPADAMSKANLRYEKKKERLEVRPLDTIEFDGPVRLVKIDVEFMELEVVRGGKEMFRTHRPVLWVENEPYYDDPPDLSFTTFMKEELNYVCRSIARLELLCVHGKFDEGDGRLPPGFHRVFRHLTTSFNDIKLWQALHEVEPRV
eukprot:TRINITY_DN7787_c0_g1_i1.p1 TRINITY_DN7787_c0_g1~~TRINITY_DN7787_c0_g1_i1.p1  ORF type:complete len:482 (-),score=75.16 TRINITY_DN7787_c0_g1_i1:339-1784(-)